MKPKAAKTAFEQELVAAAKQVQEYKLACEANIVAAFYKQSDLLFDYDLKLTDFSNNTWRVYWQIAHDIVVQERKPVLDEVTVGLYLEKHPKLRQKYDEYGGFDTISRAGEYVKVENLSGYMRDLTKWNVVLQLLVRRFPVAHRLAEFADKSVDELYAEYEASLNHIFISVDADHETFSLEDGLEELIEHLDKGHAVGLALADMPLLTKETGGDLPGNITLVGGLSNVGKTTFARTTKIPSILKSGERLVVMLNEEDQRKWQREMLVWVANNIYHDNLQKYTVRDGSYTPETRAKLDKAANWIREKAANHTITLIPFKRYTSAQAIKVIKKYASLGVKYFLLDTFKADAGTRSETQFWLQMQQAMVDINDCIKPAGKNVHITITFQLAKTSARQRMYTQDNIGMSKNIIDPVSTCLMVRDIFDDELPGGRNELKVYRMEGKNGRSKVPVTLHADRHYQILFIVKNREGSANQFQIVVEHDMSRNTLKEVGICHVAMDF